MRTIGYILLVVGATLALFGLFMNTTVSTELGGVHNIGLLNTRLTLLLFGGFMAVVGAILSFAPLGSSSITETEPAAQPRIPLSISQAWDESKGVLARDGALLATVAIALLVLPGVIGDLVTPDAPPGQLPSPGPWLIVAGIAVLIGLVGQLAIIWLAMGSGASVGESLKHALRRAPSYIAATIIWVFPFALAIYALMISITPENPSPAAGLALLVLLPVMLFFFVRMILTSAVATAEKVGALAILKRSWRLTAGSWWRLFGFFLVLVVAAVIVMVAVGAVVGLLARLVFGDIEPMTVGALVESLLTQLAGAALTVVFIVMLARIYVQLAGDRSAEVSVPTSGT